VNNSLERWVVVYGFTTPAQYESVIHHFDSFGRIVSHRLGQSNWVALEYESLLQTEKALTQTCLLMDGVVVGVTRLTLSLRQSLDWNSASTLSTQVQPFHKSHMFKEEDVLLLTNGSPKNQTQFEIGASRNVCSRFLAWWFGWTQNDME
jgi:Nup53/35/40-type RNA recognition motif